MSSGSGQGTPVVGKFREVHPGSLVFQIQLGEQLEVGRPFSPRGPGSFASTAGDPNFVFSQCWVQVRAALPLSACLTGFGGWWASSPGKDAHPVLPLVAAHLPCLLPPPSWLQPRLLLQIHEAFPYASVSFKEVPSV